MVSRERTRFRTRTKVLVAVAILGIGGIAFLGGVIVPLYSYPGVNWTAVIAAKEANPSVPMVVIINPDNGPGSAVNQAYVSGINKLVAAGVTVLGYVYTSYAGRSISSIEADMNTYKAWYNVGGIFFDEMSNVNGKQSYYSTLNAYSDSIGLPFTVGNPGGDVPESFVGTLQVIVTYESPGVPSSASLASITYGLPKNDFAVIAYGVNVFNATSVAGVYKYASYVYVTNNTLPNPYAALGGDFGKLVNEAADLISPPALVPLTVQSMNAAGSPIVGLSAEVMSSNGSVVASGLTPLTYSVTSGSSYLVSVANSGSFDFTHWSDGGTNPTRTVTETQGTTLTADYASSASTSTSSSISSTSGSTSTGSATTSASSGVSTSTQASTSTTSTLPVTTTVTVTASATTTTATVTSATTSTQTVTSTLPVKTTTATVTSATTSTQTVTSTLPVKTTTVTATGPTVTQTSTTTQTSTATSTSLKTTTTTLTTSGPTTTVTKTTTTTVTVTTTSSGPASLTVQSVNQYGTPITGFRTVLLSSSGTEIASGFTPVTFTTPLTAGVTYSAIQESYASCTFNHWQDNGNTNAQRSFVASGAQTFVAVYECTNATLPAPHGGSTVQPIAFLMISFVVGSTLILGRSRSRRAESAKISG